MKNKVLISVAAVAALIGAGFATYATITKINDNIAAEQSAVVSVDTDIENDILVKELDVKRAEGEAEPAFSVTTNESQTVTFNVKAVSFNKLTDGAKYNIYNAINDLDSDIVDEVKAKLNLHVEVIPGTLEQDESFSPLSDEALTKYLSYFALPEKGYYTWASWLAKDCEANGFVVPFEIKWAEAYQETSLFEQVKDSGNEEVEAAITEFKDATDGVVLQFKFSVGSVKEGYERIDKAYTGAITVNDINNNGVMITPLGSSTPVTQIDKLEAGEALFFDVYKDAYTYINSVTSDDTQIENPKFYVTSPLEEGKTYVINIASTGFVKSFETSVKLGDEVSELATVEIDGDDIEGKPVAGEHNVTVTILDDAKVEIDSVKLNDTELETETAGVYTVDLVKGEDYTFDVVLKAKATEKTVDVSMAAQGFSNAESITSIVADTNITLEFAQGEGSNKPTYYDSGTALRLYKLNTFEIKSISSNIIKVVVTYVTPSNKTESSVSANLDSYEEQNHIGTWESDTSTSSIKFTVNNDGAQKWITGISVTYIPD